MMKPDIEIDRIMSTIPEKWRGYWCMAKQCACLGCVQTGNKLIMAKETTGKKYLGDPEYINPNAIPTDIFVKNKVTKEEWEHWLERHPEYGQEDR
jgi:hypothetical protein